MSKKTIRKQELYPSGFFDSEQELVNAMIKYAYEVCPSWCVHLHKKGMVSDYFLFMRVQK